MECRLSSQMEEVDFGKSRNKNMKPKVMLFEIQVFRQMQLNLILDKKYSASKIRFSALTSLIINVLKRRVYRNLSRTV